MVKKPTGWASFLRYNIVSIFATGIDFLVFIILSKVFGVWYIAAAILGAIAGGVVAFWLNRNWVFESKEVDSLSQFLKYALVWGVSALLNTIGLFLLVENLGLEEVIAKIIATVTVGIGFNFFASKFFVFKKEIK